MLKQGIIKKIDKIMQGESIGLESFELIEIKNSLRIADFVSNNMEKFVDIVLKEQLDNIREGEELFVLERKGSDKCLSIEVNKEEFLDFKSVEMECNKTNQ